MRCDHGPSTFMNFRLIIQLSIMTMIPSSLLCLTYFFDIFELRIPTITEYSKFKVFRVFDESYTRICFWKMSISSSLAYVDRSFIFYLGLLAQLFQLIYQSNFITKSGIGQRCQFRAVQHSDVHNLMLFQKRAQILMIRGNYSRANPLLSMLVDEKNDKNSKQQTDIEIIFRFIDQDLMLNIQRKYKQDQVEV